MNLNSARHCTRDFPPYRFVPGTGMPHPICHPRGHSHLARELRLPRSVEVDASRPLACEEFLFGVDLYNHGFFWEAQDSWEACWRGMSSADPLEPLFRALVQASVSQLKIRTGQIDGATSIGNRACLLFRLAATVSGGDVVFGIAARDYASALETYLKIVLADASPRHEARLFPFLRVTTGPRLADH